MAVVMEVRFMPPEVFQNQSNKNMKAKLLEQDGDRIIWINLGKVSASHLLWEIHEIKGRTMIFKFVPELMNSLASNIEKMVIYDMADKLFLAHVVIKDDRAGKIYNLDLPVIEALTLAVAAKCPIFVTEEVFTKLAAINDNPHKKMSDEEMRRFLEKFKSDKIN